MFLTTTARRSASLLVAATLLAASGAYAQSTSVEAQSTTVERGLDEESGNYVMTRDRTGENGTVTTQRVCGEGSAETDAQGCVKVKTLTGADGRVYTKETLVVRGAERTRYFGRTTNANGGGRTIHRRFRN